MKLIIFSLYGLMAKTKLEEAKNQKVAPAYNPTPDENLVLTKLKARISDLKAARQTIVTTEERKSIENIWRDCDKMYPPHSYYSTALEDWQARNSQPNPYSKIMTALSTIVSSNPEVALKASNKDYEAKTNLIKALYNHSWDVGMSKNQLQLFCFNLSKYGFAVGRTYHRKLTRKIKDLVFVDPQTEEETWQEKEIDEPNDIYFENMNIWNCWFDDMAIPNDSWTCRDWCWRQVYPVDQLPMIFSEKKFPNIKYVLPGGDISWDNSGSNTVSEKQLVSKNLVEVYFYENQFTDEFHIIANNVLLTNPKKSPLPYKHKRLSCVFTQWTPRSAISLYGIGILEVMKNDQEMIDRVRDMSLDQLVMSIYQMFFHGPSTNFAEGKLRVAPGKLVQVTNPNDIRPVQFDTPGDEVVKWLEMLGDDMQESTGITKSLSGEFVGKTAFEVQQNKEAGLRKLKLPMANIEYALTLEARNRIDLIQQVYSTPLDITRIAGGKKYDEFVQEAMEHPELYTMGTKGQLYRYREARLNLEQTKDKGFIDSKTTNTIDLTPEAIRWEGEIKIQPQSTIVRSVELDRQLKLDLFNVIGRLPTISIQKASRQILKAFGEDPDDWMPTKEELAAKQAMDQQQMEQMQGMAESMGAEIPMQGGAPEPAQMESIVPRSDTKVTKKSPISQVLNAAKIRGK